MRTMRGVAVVMLMPLLLTASCSKTPEELTVAKIEGRTITVADYEHAYLTVDPKYLPESKEIEGLKEFLKTMINKEVMALKADELGYDKDEYVVQGMVAFRKVGLQAGYLKIKVADKIKVTDKDLRKCYDLFGTNLSVKQILVDRLDEAEEVRQLLVDGHDFETVCRRYSKGPDAEEGGRIVSAMYGTFEPSFQDELFATEIGGVTHPIESRYGYFVIKVLDRQRPKPKDFDDVKENLTTLVRNQQQLRLTTKMSDDIREKHGFEWFEDNIALIFELLPPDRPLTNPTPRNAEVYPLLRISPQDLDKPVVGHDGKYITLKEFSDLYDRASFFQRPRREYRWGGIKKFFLDIIMNDLVELEIKTSGIENEPEVAAALRRKEEQLMVDKLYRDLIEGQTQVSYSEVENYYRDNMEQFRRVEERRFGVILMGDNATAKVAFQRLSAGESFNRVAGELSAETDEERRARGDRFVIKGETAEIDQYGFTLARVGDVSEPFETSRGWMVLKLYEKHPERILSIAEAEADIRRYLKTLANDDHLNALLAKWREEYNIEINEKNLKKANLEGRKKSGVKFS